MYLILEVLKYFFIWVHLFSAILFIGGSFFMWLVLVPGSKDAIKDEADRTIIVAKISKRFAKLTWMLLATLIITGIANAIWYIPKNLYSSGYNIYFVTAMAISTAVLIVMLYGPGKHYGKLIAKYAGKGDLKSLTKVRKKSKLVSYANLAIMVFITIIAALM